MAIRTTYLLLTCCAGGLAAFGGWWLGEQLFFQNASASLTKDETEVVAQYPVSNRDIKNDRAIIAAPEDPGPVSQILATANAYLTAPPPRVVTPKPEKPSRLLLSDMQIAGIKQRLKLTAAQERYWPPMEAALRDVMVQVYDYQKRGKKSGEESFDTESASVTRLKETSRALFTQLRTDQKNEIMMLARIAGVSSVVAEITGGKAVAKNDE
ncbi:hypothetical protein [Bradyrhizobium sp. SYSU BS000235]|uniref:hypothetical protein n=1 Tax=Bradyrhizobium sp. SYSU BS000235 TaxID=3411332 RepID=UPI003C727C3F